MDIDPQLPTPTNVIPVQSHKLSTIVVAVEDEKALAVDKGQDDEGFTVVKSKRESKVYVDTEEEKDINNTKIGKQHNTQSIIKEVSLETNGINVECIEIQDEHATNSSMLNGSEMGSSDVLESLENVLSRKSESRISVRKRKQKNSLKSTEKIPDLIDSDDKSDLESRRKSREVFDFYVNAIDGDTASAGSQVPSKNDVNSKKLSTEKPKSDEPSVIENLLNSIPKDITNGNRLQESTKRTENGKGALENGKVTTEIGEIDLNEMEESGLTNGGSNLTSGANTLKRRKNSKKKRKSKHIL